jgi:hypothetical protein
MKTVAKVTALASGGVELYEDSASFKKTSNQLRRICNLLERVFIGI